MRDQITRVAAYALLTRAERILLCRISGKLPQRAGWWTLPGGGLDFGEHPEDAMRREVHEETGLVVRSTGFAGVDSITVKGEDTDVHSLRLMYFAEIIGGALSNEEEGSTDLCEWHSIADVRSLQAVELVGSGIACLSDAALDIKAVVRRP